MERQRAPPKGREAENGSRGIDSRGRIPERLCRCHSRYAKEKRAEAWGYIEYKEALTEIEAAAYELIPSNCISEMENLEARR